MLTEGAAPTAADRSRAIPAWYVHALLALALSALAMAARYPYLWVVPRFRDETFNALRALDIYRGRLVALTDVELYMGSFYNYAVAAGFWIWGPTIYVARLVTSILGAATVGATYLVGQQMGGAWVGIIAALLMLTNGVHIAGMGHVGFSANIAPFFSTMGFWLLARAVERWSGWTLVAAGFAWGMALHTHPITVGYLPAAALWFLWNDVRKGWRFTRTPWPYAALLLFLVAYSPMIAYNIETAGGSVRHAIYTANERPDYARNRSTELSPAEYISRQGDYWTMFYHTLGSGLDGRGALGIEDSDPSLVAMAVLAAIGVAWATVRGHVLPIMVVVSFAIILPIFNSTHYDTMGDGRYVSLALPLVYSGMGLAIVDATRWASRWLRPRWATALAAALVIIVAGAPLVTLNRFYVRNAGAEPTNASLVRAMDRLKASRDLAEVVVLDDNLNDRKVEKSSPWDEESHFRIFRMIMEFDGIPYRVVDVGEDTLSELVNGGTRAIVILSAGRDSVDTNNLGRLLQRHGMTALDGSPPRPPRPADRYGMYKFDAAVARDRLSADAGR
jgi:hypothetical protein